MKNNRKSGFSLIEVNMAVLVIGLGLLVVFGLFPAGLREGENGIVDTNCALFAERAMEGLRGEAHNKTELVDWAIWSDINSFANAFTLDIGGTTIRGTTAGTTVSGPIEFPMGANPKTYICYIMRVRSGGNSMTRTVNLWVWSGEFATDDDEKFKKQSEWYSTKYVYGKGI